MAARLLLADFEDETASALGLALEGFESAATLRVRRVAWAGVEQRLGQGRLDAELVALGEEVPEPLLAARRIAAVDRDLPVVVVSAPARFAAVRDGLITAPGLGRYVFHRAADDLEGILADCVEGLHRCNQGRSYRRTVSAANLQLVRRGAPPAPLQGFLDSLLDEAPLGVLTVRDGRVTSANPEAARLLGNQVSGALTDCFPDSAGPALTELCAAVLRGEEPPDPLQVELDGERCVEVRATVIAGNGNGEEALMVLVLDISARHRAEVARVRAEAELRRTLDDLDQAVQERTRSLSLSNLALEREVRGHVETEKRLRGAVEEARAASHERNLFLADVSHETRTPINSVLGYAQLLERDSRLAADQVRAVRAILRAGGELMGIVEDVFDLTALETGELHLNPAGFDPDEAIGEIARLYAGRCREKGIDWKFAMESDGDGHVFGDAARLTGVLGRLLANACRYTGSGAIELRVDQAGECWRFEVSDSGPGIPAAERDAVTRPFLQGGSGAASARGTGLGLTIVSGLLRLMDSELHIDGTDAGGCRTWFELRLPPADPARGAPAADNGEWLCLKPGHELQALVVDDVPDNREVLSAALGQAGLEVIEESSGEAAIRRLANVTPDIIFMDIRMPDMDGVETLARIRTRYPACDMPCVAVTGAAGPGQESHYRALGFAGMAVKPFRIDNLLRMVEQLTGAPFERRTPRVEPGPRGIMDSGSETEERQLAIPRHLYEALSLGVESGAVTDLREALDRLQRLGDAYRPFCSKLHDRLARYDFAGLDRLLGEVRHD